MLKYVNYGVVFQEIPGETTLSINISNCPFRCPGCHSDYLREDIGEELDIFALGALMDKYEDDITCVCFMGGDIEPEMINSLALLVKDRCPQLKVGWYSGMNDVSDEININNFDYIKIGSYREELGGLKSRTTNQRLYKVEHEQCVDITSKFWNEKP